MEACPVWAQGKPHVVKAVTFTESISNSHQMQAVMAPIQECEM